MMARKPQRRAESLSGAAKLLRFPALVALAGGLFAQATNTEWKAGIGKLASSTNGEDRVTLRTVPDGIQWQLKGGPAFHIPFQDVSAITYDAFSRNMALVVLDRAADAADSHACSIDCIAAVMVSPVFAPFKKQRHYVTVVWRANSETKQAVFRMTKNDCLSFAQSVSLASGQRWRDLPAERRATQRRSHISERRLPSPDRSRPPVAQVFVRAEVDVKANFEVSIRQQPEDLGGDPEPSIGRSQEEGAVDVRLKVGCQRIPKALLGWQARQ